MRKIATDAFCRELYDAQIFSCLLRCIFSLVVVDCKFKNIAIAATTIPMYIVHQVYNVHVTKLDVRAASYSIITVSCIGKIIFNEDWQYKDGCTTEAVP